MAFVREVTTEDAVKGNKESNGLIENAKCHIESSTQEAVSDDSPVLPSLVEHAGCTLSRGRKTPVEQCRMFHWDLTCCTQSS